MTISRFIHHPLIKEFNGLKRFFRKHETPISKERILDFRHFTEMINSSGDKVAFDLLGSVNFGQAEKYSDADVIIYMDCDEEPVEECSYENCAKYKIYKNLLMNTLIFEYAKDTYKVDFVDCINLRKLEQDIQDKVYSSLTLIKFGFYRSICRGINRKVLRYYESLLNKDPELCRVLEDSLAECFSGLVHSSRHSYSFKKYLERVAFHGSEIPVSVVDKINSYLSMDSLRK